MIGLTETWLTKSSAIHYSLPGYKSIENSRKNRTGGGVAFYIKENLDNLENFIHNEFSRMNETIESLLVEIRVSGSKNLLIMVMYRPPNSNSKHFLEYVHVLDLTHNPIFNNKDCFILGDFNIDISKCHIQNTSQELIDTMLSASFLPLITKPTRVTNHSATLIDNIFCNINPLLNQAFSYPISRTITLFLPVFHALKKSSEHPTMGSFRKVTSDNLANLKDKQDNTYWPVFSKGN